MSSCTARTQCYGWVPNEVTIGVLVRAEQIPQASAMLLAGASRIGTRPRYQPDYLRVRWR